MTAKQLVELIYEARMISTLSYILHLLTDIDLSDKNKLANYIEKNIDKKHYKEITTTILVDTLQRINNDKMSNLIDELKKEIENE